MFLSAVCNRAAFSVGFVTASFIFCSMPLMVVDAEFDLLMLVCAFVAGATLSRRSANRKYFILNEVSIEVN
jgi:hypothetical protein